MFKKDKIMAEVIDLTEDDVDTGIYRRMKVEARLERQSSSIQTGQVVAANNANNLNITSPNHANQARNRAIRREQSRSRADMRPIGGDAPPHGSIDCLEPYLPPKSGEDIVKFNVQFWTYYYLLRSSDGHKEGKSLQKHGGKLFRSSIID